jgi:predicted enzyme related to lactoylglutathione lyase
MPLQRARSPGDLHPVGSPGCEDAVMAITGTHALLYTSEPEAVRSLFRDVFGWKHVDAGEGWLVFALPPAELGIHPAEGPTFKSGVRHQLSFMCDDIGATVADLRSKGIEVRGDPRDEGYGITTTIVLPGDLEVMLYEPRHRTAI